MMFVGHYAAALAAKAAQPRAPFWTYVLGAQVVDMAWAGLILAGVEKMSLDPSLPGSPLVLSSMPYPHSLPAAAAWALAAGLARPVPAEAAPRRRDRSRAGGGLALGAGF